MSDADAHLQREGAFMRLPRCLRERQARPSLASAAFRPGTPIYRRHPPHVHHFTHSSIWHKGRGGLKSGTQTMSL